MNPDNPDTTNPPMPPTPSQPEPFQPDKPAIGSAYPPPPPPPMTPPEPPRPPVFGGPASPTFGQRTSPVVSPDSDPAAPETDLSTAGTDEYISNPFLNSVRGLVLTLKTNPTPALLSGLIGLLIISAGTLLYFVIALAVHSPAVVILFFVLLAMAYLVPIGTYYVIGGTSARGETVTTGEAYSKSVSRLLPFIGLSLLTGVLVFVGFLLLIVPGVIFMARSSLSPLIMFEEDLGPVAALKRSFSLTKGHLNEMLGALFASQFLGGGGGLLFGAVSVAPLVGRYHDLRQLKESGAPKPKVHWLNYTYLLALVFIAGMIAFAVIGLHNVSKTTQLTPAVQSQNYFNSNSPSVPNNAFTN